MKNPAKNFTLIIFALAFFSAGSALANKPVDDIKVPFGIRNYDIGSAQNFTLSDIDGEKFELEDSRGQWLFLHFLHGKSG